VGNLFKCGGEGGIIGPCPKPEYQSSAEARTRAPTDSDDDHEKRLKQVHGKIESALKSSALSKHGRDEYRKSIHVVLSRMTPKALARLHANVKEYKFYSLLEGLTAGIKAKYPTWKPKVGKTIKGLFDKDGTIHMNGRGDGVLHGLPASLEEFQAHELAHGIDGTKHEISGSKPWRDAWNAEINFLTHGKKSVSEGWAEFAQMLLGQGMTRKTLKEVMPKCLKVWEDNGL
jgi:hypothetical protein